MVLIVKGFLLHRVFDIITLINVDVVVLRVRNYKLPNAIGYIRY